MKTKTANKLKYSTQEELFAQFKEEKRYPLAMLFQKSKAGEKMNVKGELFTLATITCLLLVGFIFLF